MTAIQLLIARICGYIIVCIAIFVWGHHVGATVVQKDWDASKAKQVAAMATVEQKAADTSQKVVTQYVDRVQTVYQKGETITKLVPKYVTVKDDAACTIPPGFGSLLDAASQGRDLPASASSAPASASSASGATRR